MTLRQLPSMLGGSRRKVLAAVVVCVLVFLATQIYHFDTLRWDAIREHTSSLINPGRESTHSPPPTSDSGERDVLKHYLSESTDQDICERFYGVSYLRNLAKKQYRYCEDGSSSSMLCLMGDRIQGPWVLDPLCIARGAHVESGPDGLSVRLQCQLHNFSREAESSVEAAARLAGVENVDKMGHYFFNTGAGKEFQSWTFENTVDTKCSVQSNNKQAIMLALREDNTNMWHKLMEIWQAMLSLEAYRLARDPLTGQPYLSEEEALDVQVVFEDDRQELYDDLWTIATGNTPVRSTDLPTACYGTVIVPLAGSSSPFWTFLLEAREHEVCRVRTLIEGFVQRVLVHLQIEPRKENDIPPSPVVTIIDRAKTRKFRNLQGVIELLQKRHPDVKFNVVDFAQISLVEQVQLVQDTDVLVGHHGAGMTHILWLTTEAAVVEIFPPVFPTLGFRHVARMRGLVHFVGHCMPPEEWNLKFKGVPLPDNWTPPTSEAGWQEAEWTYMDEGEFVGLIDAAIRSQRHRRPNGQGGISV